VEHRPKRKPHSREEILRILDTLVEGGVDAWWYSVSGKGSYPLFPSRILPHEEKVAIDYSSPRQLVALSRPSTILSC
jgi:hypothetical protein